jgi:REP element-mobilizing transposase RayT
MDRYLDAARCGPAYLRRPEIARIVVNSILKGVELGHYLLRAWVIMPNHVHLLIEPLCDPSKLLKSLKGFTARAANQALGLTGAPFWQKESYDHWVRNDEEFVRIVAYIENNPVKAGHVRTPEVFPWSSASHRDESRCGTQ